MSRAVVRIPESGRPEALVKAVSVMPSVQALAVMCALKFPSLPPRCSATAVATSFADLTTKARIAVSTSMLSPGFR